MGNYRASWGLARSFTEVTVDIRIIEKVGLWGIAGNILYASKLRPRQWRLY